MRAVIAVFESVHLEALAAHHYAQIKDYVHQETRKELSNAEFDAGYQSLVATLQTHSEAMRADLKKAGL